MLIHSFLLLPLLAAAPAVAQDGHAQIAELAHRLAPAYVDDGPPPDEEAVGPLLDLLLALPEGHDLGDAELVFAVERLTPNLEERHTDLIAARLVAGDLPNPRLAAEMMLAAPYSESRVALARFALDENLDARQRAQAVGRILAADGRSGLERLRPLLHPQSNSEVLRRIYFFWAAMTTEDDLPFLEELVLQGPGMCREFALQTWARVETRPEKRIEIFKHSASSSSSYRSVVVRLLAQAGSSAELEQHIKEMLNAPRSENRRLALDVLPYVAGPEALLAEYKRQSSEHDTIDQQGRWMVRLARLKLAEAQQTAAGWLMEEGWRHPRYSMAVSKSLAESDAMDPLLGSFLNMDGPLAEVKISLATERAAHSADAMDYLHQVLPTAAPMHARRICHVLAASGNPQDLQPLFDVARYPQHSPMLRAEAIRQLARTPHAVDYLGRLAAEAEFDFEPAEALVTALIRSGDAELRKLGLQRARNSGWVVAGFGANAEMSPEMDGEMAFGLRCAGWRAQAAAPKADEGHPLLADLLLALAIAHDPFADGNWPEPRDLESEFTELVLQTQAAAATAPAEFHKNVPGVATKAASSAVFVCAQAALKHAPATSLLMASQLASRADLGRLQRVRALGLVARAAQLAGHTKAHLAALDRMLALLKNDRDEAVLLELAYGMAMSSPRGWLLPRDQIAQRRLLAHAASQSPEGGRTAAMRWLADGGCPTHTLIEAVEMLLEPVPDDPTYVFPSNAFLAEDLARKAIDIEPDNVQARYLLVRALIAEESPDEALVELDDVVRLAPPGSELALIAARHKEQLLSELVEED